MSWGQAEPGDFILKTRMFSQNACRLHPESRSYMSIVPGFYPVATDSVSPTPGHAPAHTSPASPGLFAVVPTPDASMQHYSVCSASQQDCKLWRPADSSHLSPVPPPLTSPHTLPAIPSPIQGSRLALFSCMLTVAIPPHASIFRPLKSPFTLMPPLPSHRSDLALGFVGVGGTQALV